MIKKQHALLRKERESGFREGYEEGEKVAREELEEKMEEARNLMKGARKRADREDREVADRHFQFLLYQIDYYIQNAPLEDVERDFYWKMLRPRMINSHTRRLEDPRPLYG